MAGLTDKNDTDGHLPAFTVSCNLKLNDPEHNLYGPFDTVSGDIMTEKVDWQEKQPTQAAFVSEDMKC